jgi:hypothetical protein
LKVVLNTKPSSPYVYILFMFFLLYRTLGFMQIPDFFVAFLKL